MKKTRSDKCWQSSKNSPNEDLALSDERLLLIHFAKLQLLRMLVDFSVDWPIHFLPSEDASNLQTFSVDFVALIAEVLLSSEFRGHPCREAAPLYT